MKKEEVLEIVIKRLNELLDTMPERNAYKVDTEFILFGRGSSIDSMSLVSLIVDLESDFSDLCGKDILLTDDRAMSREISPFDNIGNLVDYIYELINE